MQINSRFALTDSGELYTTAAFLEPRYKLLWCVGSNVPGKSEEVKRSILNLMKRFQVTEREVALDETATTFMNKRPSLVSHVGEKPNKSTTRKVISAEAELQLYLQDDEAEENPLDFWKRKICVLPRLSVVAKELSCTPATAAGC